MEREQHEKQRSDARRRHGSGERNGRPRHRPRAAVALYVALGALAAIAALASCRAPLERRSFDAGAMGTSFRLVFYADDAAAAERAAAAAFERVRALEAVFSDYDAASEARRIAAGAPGVFGASRELVELTALALEVSAASGGAFDVTVGPLTRLWRRAARRGEPPDAADLARARAAVGWRKLRVDRAKLELELLAPDMRLDYGAIAKGYAAGAALAVLAEHGFERALVDAGGDLACGAPPPGELGWTVALEGLEGSAGGFAVAHAGVATSGDRYRGFDGGGERRSHVLDPRSGDALQGASAVTVVARGKDCGALADALSTAASVLAPSEALKLVESFGAEARIERLEGGERRVAATAGFPTLSLGAPRAP